MSPKGIDTAAEEPSGERNPRDPVEPSRGGSARVVPTAAKLLVAFLVLNGVLYVGQEIMATDEKRQAQAIEQELDQLDLELQNLGDWFSEQDERVAQMDTIGDGLDDPSLWSSEAGRFRAQDEYLEMVDRWNNDLPFLETERERYDDIVTTYNSAFERYNRAAEAAYSRWWLLPIPLPRTAGRSVQ